MTKNNQIRFSEYIHEWLIEKNKKISFELILNEIRKKKIIEIYRKYKFKKILEIGCGLKPLFLYLDLYDKYTIVEPSKEFCNIAKGLIDKDNKDKVFIIEDIIENVYTKLKDYDFIILSSLLHEVPDPNKILKAVYSIADDNTIIHINVPNVYSIHNLIGYKMNIIKNLFQETPTGKRFGRHTRFDMKRLIKILEDNNFKIIETGSYFIKPFANHQLEKMLEYDIINEQVIEGLEKIIVYLPEFGAEIYANVKKFK
ncbi:MAG: class I SAM-dependent methyltransferase [Promethearchaeia archaeon]